MNAKIVCLKAVREQKQIENSELAYRAKILQMSKPELIQEMMLFQEKRTQQGRLTAEMMVQGQCLFELIEKTAETQVLADLAKSYRRHLRYELQSYKKNI